MIEEKQPFLLSSNFHEKNDKYVWVPPERPDQSDLIWNFDNFAVIQFILSFIIFSFFVNLDAYSIVGFLCCTFLAAL